MTSFVRYTRTSVGAKHVMAVTGLLLLAFAIFHMVGHLQVFGGAAIYNGYAHFLQNLWEVKWPVRAGLLALLVIHIVTALGVVAKNRAARPVGYAMYRPMRASIVGRSMALTGVAIAAFLIVHLYQFTLSPPVPGDPYRGYVSSFGNPICYAAYFAGMGLLAMHLGHGASTWLQSLGLRHPSYPMDRLGPIVAVTLFVGYMLPPTAVLLGVIS